MEQWRDADAKENDRDPVVAVKVVGEQGGEHHDRRYRNAPNERNGEQRIVLFRAGVPKFYDGAGNADIGRVLQKLHDGHANSDKPEVRRRQKAREDQRIDQAERAYKYAPADDPSGAAHHPFGQRRLMNRFVVCGVGYRRHEAALKVAACEKCSLSHSSTQSISAACDARVENI